MSIKETKDGVLLHIFVKPNASKFKFEVDGEEVVVYSTEEPVKGRVNKEIIKESGKLLGFQVEIISGMTSKQKVLLFRGANKTEVKAALAKMNL
ncbi:MAG: hypothetical protein GX799_09115 [Crenarchaeota archaeon]|jgi:uncharacterized protein (TIGR00251 family)|nr:hypothetical protein [Thermoproteota archaeon]